MTEFFKEWNLLLLSEYFSPAVAGDEVWIQTNRAELDSFGFHLGGAAGLVEAVQRGPEWHPLWKVEMAQNAMDLANLRCSPNPRYIQCLDPGESIEVYKHLDAPAYLPYVALWVLAASEVGAEGFYAAVSELVDAPFEGAAARTTLETLWQDLEYWSDNQCDGELGFFHSKPIGKHRYVGLTKAQALVTGKDKDGINQLFNHVGLSAGQDLSDSDFLTLSSIAVDSHYLSNSLREALRQLKIYRPVLEELFRVRLLEWDGRTLNTVGRNKYDEYEHIDSADQTKADVEDELSLVLRPAFESDWEIGWRFESNDEGIGYTLEIGDTAYLGYANESTGYVTCLESGKTTQLAAQSVLNVAIEQDTLAIINYTREGDENGAVRRSYIFPTKSTRLLIWDTSNPAYGQELIERELPMAGPAYVLTSEKSTFDYLKNHTISHQRVEGNGGLPEGWMLLVLDSVDSLNSVQRGAIQKLVGDAFNGLIKARLKLTGGCPILRGGKKQYADYDLPLVELDAPVGTEIVADGLRLEEVILTVPTVSDYNQSSIRRFSIHRENRTKHRFEIFALLNQEALGVVNLKVASPVGLGQGAEKTFSIGPFGESQRTEAGIRGAIIDDFYDPPVSIAFADFHETSMWGTEVSSDEYDNSILANIACKLVDMVAQKGSIEYRAAKLMTKRLAQEESDLRVQPAILMLQLRSRGFLEIETDQKGHFLRLHAASPTIYSTPILLSTGATWYGVCGSLRLEQWRLLFDDAGVSVRIESLSNVSIPTIRIAAAHKKNFENLLENCNFEFAEFPASSILGWASTLKETRERLHLNKGYENFRVKNLQQLNPQSALFSDNRSAYMKVDSKRKCELFKIDDPVIQGHQVYMLGSLVDGRNEYNYIQDSRSGIWLALSAFSQMISRIPNFEDAHPWPIPYAKADGSFWLPARMRPPLMVERALCLSSGGQPRQVRVEQLPTAEDDLIELVDTTDNDQIIGKVSRLYTEMCDGTWLRYPYVSEELANTVAAHLGCKLMYL